MSLKLHRQYINFVLNLIYMKIKIINLSFILILILLSNSIFSQVGIGTVSPNTSAMLDVDVASLASNGKKGFLPPRMTTTERDNIGLPASGLLIYNTDTDRLNYYNGADWQVVDTSTGYVDLINNQTNIGGDKTFTGTLTPDGRLMLPMGELSYFNQTGLTITLGTVDVFERVESGTGINFLNDMFDTNQINGDIIDFDASLTYRGATTRLFHIALSFSFSPGTNNDVYVFGVAKNGVVENKSKVIIKGSSTTDNQSSAMHVALWLSTDDYLEFYVAMVGDTGTIVMKSFNFFAMGM